MNKKDNKNIPVSTHIFMFPFKWDIKKSEFSNSELDTNIVEIDRKLKKNNWEVNEFKIEDDFDYGSYIYFYPFVRNAILNGVKKEKDKKNCIVNNYEYKFEEGYYNIKLKQKKEEYKLKINSIKLKIFNTGVGILSFETENYSKIDFCTKAFEDILNINDFGRRIYPQFYPMDCVKNSFLADELSITLNDKNGYPRKIKEDFTDVLHTMSDSTYGNCSNPRQYTYISKTIMQILGNDDFTYYKEDKQDDRILITPIIDDRMFIINFINNKYISSLLTKNIDNNKKWAKLLFVDNDDLTIQDEDMVQDLIKKHTYRRWLNYGTVYGITRYSFLGVAGDAYYETNILRNHFKTMYYEMTALVLALRASIISFSNEAASISAFEIDKENNGSDQILISKIDNLYKRYIEFVNRLYFREVTAQEQGIEIYEMLINSMNIERDIKDLNNEIEKLYNYATLKAERNTNKKINIITLVGALIAIPSFFTGFFGMNIFANPNDLIKWFTNKTGLIWTYMYIIFPICIISIFLRQYTPIISIGKLYNLIKDTIKHMDNKERIIVILLITLLIVLYKF
ncbi:CorA family divalent cation transporter [Clostridiisalibacter paucivorans]|uniref:CorA family divalent cation transporter n=1 Tax=Clostridiisalibacter paucivorans TaxID=408753 RepID=UPI00047EDE42|nr:CorA family divalent cation transporter [Clostridiisalibacter paucivorans]